MKNKEDILKFLKDNKPYIAKKFYVSKIGLFGSYAKEKADNNSDIDIIFDFNEKAKDIYTLKQELREYLSAKLDKKIDLAREKYLKNYAKKEILKSVIYV